MLDALSESVTTAVLTQHEIRARQPDILGQHDFVSRSVLNHAVLMDAGFVCKSVLADDRLVSRRVHTRHGRYDSACRIQALCIDTSLDTEEVLPRLDRHDDFLERAIARALTDAVDRAFDLTCTGLHGGQAVRDGHAQIVVAVHAQTNIVDAGDVLLQVAEQLIELTRHRIANGIGYVHRRCAGADRGLDDLSQILELRSRGILGGELDIITELSRQLNAFDRGTDDLVLGHLQLVLAMDLARCNEHVDARALGVLKSIPRAVYVLRVAARQTANRRAFDRLGDPSHSVEVTGGGGRKTSFDDVDAEIPERSGDTKLLIEGHAAARGLLAVSQCGVEYDDSIVVHCVHGSISSLNKAGLSAN